MEDFLEVTLGGHRSRRHVHRRDLGGRSLVRYHVLFAIKLATRRVEILGIVPEPYGTWMEQVARNATDAFAERFVRSIKEECLSRMILFSEKQLRTAVSEYVEHYHRERNHQGLVNRLIQATGETANATGAVVCESRLGGLLNHYRRAA